MRVLQVARLRGDECGIALFAGNLEAQLRAAGVEIETVDRALSPATYDLLLLQHHPELFRDEEVSSLAAESGLPVVLFAHAECVPAHYPAVSGFMAMGARMLAPTPKPVCTFPYPAWAPPALADRLTLRRELNLPPARPVVGTHGFLRFERQFVEVVEALLPEARRTGWFIELVASPWRLDSPGLPARLQALGDSAPDHFRFHYGHLDGASLNRRLQACDLLWCWTAAPSSSYASGVIADQYASGTRIVAADKEQHRDVLALPNTVAAPAMLASFLNCLIGELRAGPGPRHDPSLVSWDNCIAGLLAFLRRVADEARGKTPLVRG